MITLRDLRRRLGEDDYYVPQVGTDLDGVAAKKKLAARVLATFEAHFDAPADREVAVYYVPGRVEVLGKHTDYAGGHSLLIAADRGFLCVSSLNDAGRIRIVDEKPEYGACEFDFRPDLEPPVGHWSNYPMTLTQRLAANFGSALPWQGVDVAFGSDLPVGGGLSGSSALMIMTYFALAGPNRLAEQELFRRNIQDSIDLAMYLACVENGQTFRELVGGKGVGTFGGSEDHTEILNGRAGFFSLFQFCPTVHKADVAFPSDWILAIGHSGVRAEKTGGAMAQYNLVAHRARQAVAWYNRTYGTHHTFLRELIEENRTLDESALMGKVETAVAGRTEAGQDLGLPQRFAQFYAEDRQIIPDVARALIVEDWPAVGQLVDRSHTLSRENLWNIIPEIDFLQQQAREQGALAASGFGAGFGGSAYALVERAAAPDFLRRWQQAYAERFPEPAAQAHFFLTQPAGNAGEMFG